MANALDAFREQRAAAGQVYAIVKETCELLRGLQIQVSAFTNIQELKTLLQQEERWLQEAQRVVAEAQRQRDDDLRRLRPAAVRQWALAVALALAGAAAAGVGSSWWTRPYQAELGALRSRMEFAEYVEHRALAMTPAERRQFDALMKWPPTVGKAVPGTKR
jgi:hypothetical protein